MLAFGFSNWNRIALEHIIHIHLHMYAWKRRQCNFAPELIQTNVAHSALKSTHTKFNGRVAGSGNKRVQMFSYSPMQGTLPLCAILYGYTIGIITSQYTGIAACPIYSKHAVPLMCLTALGYCC